MNPGDLGLPAKFSSWRPNQLELAAKIAASSSYCYLLDSPTGTGKSLIAAASQKLLSKKAVYLCVTKQLQDQILHDFPYAKTLMGRSNYQCLKYPTLFPKISAEDCTHSEVHECPRRGSCPYIIAKQIAFGSPLAVLNTAYFLNEANHVGMFGKTDFLVIDELDTLESQLMGYIQLTVTKKQLDRLNVDPPRFKTKFEAWIEWARSMLKELEPELERLTQMTEKEESWGGIDLAMLKRKNAIMRLVSKLRFFVREVDNTWVPFFGTDEWTFKPVWVSKYSNGVLWKHAKKILGMSATILDPRQVALNVGLVYGGERTFEYKSLSSPFPKENRPVFYEPCANIINRNMEEALPKLASKIERIMEKHPDEKILCHVVSYRIRDYILKNIRSNRFVTHDTATRASVLEAFKITNEPKVLVSPSMERGVDLPGEECRVVIIAKVPYPDLGDPQVNKRVHASKDGNNWYAHRTVSSIIQMSGRACLPAGQKVITSAGNLEDIEKVSGNLLESAIKERTSREYSGELVVFRAARLLEGITTEDHLILTANKVACLKGFKTICTPGCVIKDWYKKNRGVSLKCEPDKLTPTWVAAGDLMKSKHFLAFPIPIRVIDRGMIDDILVDEDFLTVLGLYLAEGIIQGNTVGFCLGPHESELREELCARLRNMRQEPYSDSRGYIYFTSQSYTNLFKQCGTSAWHKSIPEFAMHLPPDKQAHLVRGYAIGDGNLESSSVKDKSRVTCGTVSQNLAMQIWLLVLRQRMIPSISIVNRLGKDHTLNGRKIKGGTSFTVRWDPCRGKGYREGIIHNDYLYTPIISINHISYKGLVYNVETALGSYSTPFGHIHNCRSVDDWANTYILDEQFSRLYREHHSMFPGWFREAVIM